MNQRTVSGVPGVPDKGDERAFECLVALKQAPEEGEIIQYEADEVEVHIETYLMMQGLKGTKV